MLHFDSLVLGPILLGGMLCAPSSAAPQVIREHVGGGMGHQLGRDVAFVGDFDGDGVGDYVIFGLDGSLGASPPFISLRSGATGNFIRGFGVLSGPGPRSLIERVGDVDGDGTPDLGVADIQSVGVISGATDTRIWTFVSPTTTPRLVSGFAAVGDVDLDGIIDLAVTGQDESSGIGATAVFSGANGQVLWGSPLEGTSVTRIGDANGDGFDDLVIGDSNYSVQGVAALLGRALVLDGTSGALIRIHRTFPVTTGQRYGASVCRVEDVDGDAVDDFAVAATALDRNGSYPAWIDLWSSSTGELIRRIERIGDNGLGGGRNGSLVSAGDLDGDGAGDFIAGNQAVYLNEPQHDFVRAFSGATGRTIAIVPGVGGAGEAVDFGSDVDGDGMPDVIFGAPSESGSGFFEERRQGRVTIARLLPVADAVARFCEANQNSTGLPGRIDWSGSTSRAANDLVLHATQLPSSTFGLFLYETDRFFNTPVGNGRLCILSPRRINVIVPTGTGSVAFPVDLVTLPQTPWRPLLPGDTRAFQFWYRDTVGAGSNVTDALAIDFRD